MPLVEIKELFISFGVRPAVDGVSFSFEPGERFGLIGESGSGKSLTALALAGLLPEGAEIAGTILFDGAPLPTGDREMAQLRGNRIGMVFQEPMTALNPLMKVGNQIGEAVSLHFPKRDVDARIEELFSEVGLETRHRGRYPHQLSGGQRQRIMIAIALAAEPELLICDEPTSALDVITQRRILSLLDRVCKSHGMALLFISHDMRAVASLCGRIGVLKSGVMVEVGPGEQIFSNPQSDYARELVEASKVVVPPMHELITRTPLFEAHGVSKQFTQGGWLSFPRPAPLVAVDDVRFTVSASEAVALVGPSGCGKTTLARMVAGLERPSDGHFVLEGERYGDQKHLSQTLQREVSLVFQDPFGSFDPRYPVGRSVGEPLRLVPELTLEERTTRIVEAIEAVELSRDMLDRYPHEFSGGQRQRLAIARALVTRPRLVVLDEPVSALDVSLRGSVLSLLNHLRAEFGMSYLIISHDLDMVHMAADRVMVMEAGKIVEEASPQTLFSDPQHALTKELLAARLPEPHES